MPLNLRGSEKLQNFNVPVSYRIHDTTGKFLDARNVNSIQGRLDTRYGYSRLNALSLGGKVLSLSSFIKSDNTRYTIAKVGTDLISVSIAGTHTVIKSGLSPLTKHRALTGNDRHIIAIEQDGLFTWDGITFTQLGQKPPQIKTTDHPDGFVLSTIEGGTLTAASRYKVGLSFYASSTGFETNIQPEDENPAIVPAGVALSIQISNIPIVADNALIDKVYIYLKNATTNGEYLFIEELELGTTSYVIKAESTSAVTPPINNGIPGMNGGKGGKYLANFNSKLVYVGNDEFPNDVFFSEEDIPDAFNPFDTGVLLPIPGQGQVTGLGVGLFGDTVLDPFLVIFKRKSTRIYSEIGGLPKLVVLSEEIGCVSHDTIQVKNGIVYFLSEEGWRGIVNGRFITNPTGEAVTLGNGDIDDIFKSDGYVYEVNRQGMANAFSVYYPTLDQYMTWVSEAQNDAFTKTYVYEYDVGGFKPYEFSIPATCAILGENSIGRDQVLFGTADGFIMKHSILEPRLDTSIAGDILAINAFAVLPWMPDADFDATYNFRELILKAITSVSPLTVKTFINYNLSTEEQKSYDFADPSSGFILDRDQLDIGVLGDDRAIVTARADINRVGETLAIGFYQAEPGANIGLVSMQIDSSKNGNRNFSTPEDEEAVFDAETGTYFPSVSESVRLAQYYAELAAASAAEASSGGGLPVGFVDGDFLQFEGLPAAPAYKSGIFSGFSAHYNKFVTTASLFDAITQLFDFQYSAPGVTLSATPGQGVREKGSTVGAVTLNAATVKRSLPITGTEFFRDGVSIGSDITPIAGGGTESLTYSVPFSDSTSFYARTTDGTGTTQSSTLSFPYAYPYFYGVGAPGLNSTQIASLTKLVIASTSTVAVSTSPSSQVFYFAYPASYPALTKIIDPNTFDVIASFTQRSITITGLDGTTQTYRVYEGNTLGTGLNIVNSYQR